MGCVTDKAAVFNHGVTEEKFVPNYSVTHIQEGGKSKASKNVSVPTEVENVSVLTEVELDVTTDPEVEKQMLSLAPSNKEGIIVNVAPTQFGDCNLASKNVSVPTEVEFGVNTDPEDEKQMPRGE